MSKYFVLKPEHLDGNYLRLSDEGWNYWFPSDIADSTIFDEEKYLDFISVIDYYMLEDTFFIKQPIILQELLSSDAK